MGAVVPIVSLALVFLIYGVFGFLLYRARFFSSWMSTDFDSVTFGLPFCCAVAANFGILYFWIRPHTFARELGLCAISFGLAAVAFWAYMICALNTYGE